MRFKVEKGGQYRPPVCYPINNYGLCFNPLAGNGQSMPKEYKKNVLTKEESITINLSS
jgi:hypothetical protein